MTVFCLFDNFGTDTPELVGVVDTLIAAMCFVGYQFNAPVDRMPMNNRPQVTRYFEEIDVKERYERIWR